eukprot:TRINITY_DN15494_c0_g1_i1.p1 TRINITY_DN15494_c0_g1~~TRINITY_DN15494_c0_g1_i1.p1  ORF type:complete len:257 (-),score=44.21 TRINITY_DN15494_c0_g1_i1:112-882(-)
MCIRDRSLPSPAKKPKVPPAPAPGESAFNPDDNEPEGPKKARLEAVNELNEFIEDLRPLCKEDAWVEVITRVNYSEGPPVRMTDVKKCGRIVQHSVQLTAKLEFADEKLRVVSLLGSVEKLVSGQCHGCDAVRTMEMHIARLEVIVSTLKKPGWWMDYRLSIEREFSQDLLSQVELHIDAKEYVAACLIMRVLVEARLKKLVTSTGVIVKEKAMCGQIVQALAKANKLSTNKQRQIDIIIKAGNDAAHKAQAEELE